VKTLITVTRTGDAIRVAKVTAHGEELLEPDAEARALAILLWAKLADHDPQGGSTLLPWGGLTSRMDQLTAAVMKLTVALDQHAKDLADLTKKVQAVAQPTPVPRGQ